MSRNEAQTCRELIEPALVRAGWQLERELRIGPGRVNITGEAMYDESQAIIADYQLRYRGIPLVILEAKAEGLSAADGMQQGSRYARRLLIRFSLASNGHNWILTDNDTGGFESLPAPPTPNEIVARHGVTLDWDRWEGASSPRITSIRSARSRSVLIRTSRLPRRFGSSPRARTVCCS